MKKFFILLITALAFAALTSCSKLTEEDLYGDYPDDTDTPSDTEASDTADTTTEDPTDTADTNAQGDTDINDTDVNDTDVNDTDVNDTDVNDTDVNDTDPTDPTTDPTDPTTDPTDPTTDPTDPTTDPTDPTTDPTDPTTDPTDDDPINPTDDDPINPTDDDTEISDEDTFDPDDIVPDCVPQCEGKACGHDGCGGICNTDCGANAACNETQTKCVPYNCDKITVTNFQDWGSSYHGNCQYQNQNYDLKLIIKNPENLSNPVDLSQFPKYNRCSKNDVVCLYFFYGSDKLFFQQSGNIDISQSGTFPLTNIRLVETGYVLSTTVTYEIPGGSCIEILNQSFDYFVY